MSKVSVRDDGVSRVSVREMMVCLGFVLGDDGVSRVRETMVCLGLGNDGVSRVSVTEMMVCLGSGR